jgi:hypothetical protein
MILAGRRRLARLEERVDELESLARTLHALPLEWQDQLDRMTRIMQRINRRAERDGAPPDDPPQNPAALRLLGIR